MGVKIVRRQLRTQIEGILNRRGTFLPEFESFWRQVLQDAEFWQRSDEEPVHIITPWNHLTWIYKNIEFNVGDCYDFPDDEIKLLIRDALDRLSAILFPIKPASASLRTTVYSYLLFYFCPRFRNQVFCIECRIVKPPVRCQNNFFWIGIQPCTPPTK